MESTQTKLKPCKIKLRDNLTSKTNHINHIVLI